MTKNTINIHSQYLLIVEGVEDKRFFSKLIENLGLHDIQILPIGGKTRSRDNLKALISSPNFSNVTSIGIIRDANGDPSATFQSVQDAVRFVGLPVPQHPLEFSSNDECKVGIVILPNGHEPGMLEDLCLAAVRSDPAMLCMDQYFQCLQQQGLPLPRSVVLSSSS